MPAWVRPEPEAEWDRLAAAYPGDARAQLTAWLARMTDHIVADGGRGCALANAAVELAEKDHPARKVIEEVKRAQRNRLVTLCEAAALTEPEFLADELFLLLEGARVSAQSVGADGPAAAPRAHGQRRSSPRTRRAGMTAIPSPASGEGWVGSAAQRRARRAPPRPPRSREGKPRRASRPLQPRVICHHTATPPL